MIVRLFVAVGVVIAASGLGTVPVGPAPAAWSSPLVVDPAQGGEPDPGGGTGGDSSGDSSSGDAVASKPKGSESSDSGGGNKAPEVGKAPDSAPDSNSDSGSSGEQAEVAAPPPGSAAQDGTNSSGTDTPNATADPGALTEPDSGASGQKQNLSPVVNREPESELLADNPNPVTQDLVNKYQSPPPTDPNATAPNAATAPPTQDGTQPPVGVAPGTVPPSDPAAQQNAAGVQPKTAEKSLGDRAAEVLCIATSGASCFATGTDPRDFNVQTAHDTLDVASFVPHPFVSVPSGAINSGIYAFEDKKADAGIAAAAMIPSRPRSLYLWMPTNGLERCCIAQIDPNAYITTRGVERD